MAISAAKVKAVCSNAEVALVRASRKPELETNSAARLNQLASRARKLSRKWQTLERDQARTRGRATGHTEGDTNTALKAEIFRDALAAFEAQAAKLAAQGDGPVRKSSKPSKQKRSAEHRARRAAMRKGMTAAEDLMNLPTAKPRVAKQAPVAKPAAAAQPAPAAVATTKPAAAKPAVKAKSKKSAPVGKLAPPTAKPTLNKSKQLSAKTAAKKSRVAMSGKQTRALGHLKASTKRSQAKRDSK